MSYFLEAFITIAIMATGLVIWAAISLGMLALMLIGGWWILQLLI